MALTNEHRLGGLPEMFCPLALDIRSPRAGPGWGRTFLPPPGLRGPRRPLACGHVLPVSASASAWPPLCLCPLPFSLRHFH